MERAKAKESCACVAMNECTGHGRLVGKWALEKFNSDLSLKSGVPDEVLDLGENTLLNQGINKLWQLCSSGSSGRWGTTGAYIHVGNSTVAASASQTALQGASKAASTMMSGYPIAGSSQGIVFKSQFGSTEANFAWYELSVVNGSSDTAGVNMNRKVQSMGTKVSGATWQVTCTVTLS